MGEAPSGKFIVVKWESKHDIDQERLKTFVEVKTKECPTIVTGNIKHAALLVFKTEQGTNILQYQLLDPEFWKVQSISVVEESTSLWVTNIPARCEERDLFRFFTNSVSLDNLKLDTHLKVDHDYFSPEDGVAVVHLKTLTDLNDACKKQKKFKKFKDCQLFLTPFYKDIYGVQKPIDETPFTMDIKDETKLMYMIEFWKEEIEEEIKTLYCTKINWPRDHTICKVKFTFDCHHDDHRSQRGKKWKADVDNKFKDYQEQIKIDARFVDDSIKSEVNGIIDKYTGTKVSVENNLNSNKLLLIGRNKEEEWMVLQKQLDSIQPPEPKATAKVRLESNRPRVIAFKDMGLKHTMEFKSVVVEVDIDGCTISVTGNATEVPDAERNVLKLLADMCEQEVHIPDDDYKQILTTDHMKDEIDKCIKKRGTRCAFVSAGDTMILFSMDNNELIDMEKEVINLIARFTFKLEGRIYRNKEIFEKKIKAIEEEFSSHARLSHQQSNTDVKISIVCEQIILRNAIEKIKNELGPLLARKEPLCISDFIVKYIMDNNTISNIRRDIREAKLSENILVIDSELKYLAVEGVEEDRKKVVEIVKKYAHGIYASWRNLSGETIDQYCEKSDFQTFLLQTIKTHSCKFKIARKHELKESLIYCVAVMKSGQAIFVVNASFNDLENADVIVSVTNPELKPGRKGLARDLVDRGGEIIQDKCDERVKLKGSLGISEVFVSDAGKLQCQKIIHAVGPVWQGGQNNEEQMLSVTLENILKVMNNDNEFILRSIATPLIGHGQGKFSAKRSARVMLRTLNDKLKDYPNVREIFLVDFDPKTVRTIQKEMHALFGELCFHTPVENIGFGKGTVVSTKPGLFCLRSGSRRIPLPGGKVLCIKWGKLQDTGTEIIVSPTPTAPLPSGLIINALAAKSVHVDLKSECSKEFKKQPKVENGTIVQTVGPVGSIYHLKIEPKWDQGKGAKNLEDYTKSCLSRAILNKIKFIALPPIGVADNSYPAVDVARTMIRTVALFVKDKPKCSLEEINIVIHDTDMATTSAFEHVMGEMFSRRPHRLEANILDSVKEKKSLGPLSDDATKAANKSPPNFVSNAQRVYHVAKNATVELVKGSLELATTDVIVGTTSSFPNLNGAIVSALQKNGGPSLQRELRNQYRSYPGNGVAVSGGGKLKCKRVFYSLLEQYDPKKKGLHMKVTQCLQQADNEGMHSIAFPTFGTGNFGYPAQVSADQMFGAIRTFFQTTRHNLITVVIFLYAPDNETSQVFEKSIGSFFQPYVQPTVDIKQDKPGDNKDKALKANFKASIITTFGNLEESKTDVILDTTTNFPKLNGIIPQNLLKAAGKELQDECDAKDKVTENMVVKTKAYKLKCQNIYHFVMPQWNQAKGETIISDCIYKCLMMMKGDALTSIAVPAIGTGGAKYDPATVAKGICSAVTRFGSESPDYACVVTVVFYPGGPQEPNTIIKSIIDKWKTDRNSEAGQPKPIKGVKMVNFNMPIEDDEDEDDVTFEIPKDTREFLLLQFMSDKTENVDTAFNTIKERIDKDRKEIVVTLDNKDAVDEVALIENDKKTFEEFGRIFKVSLNIDLKQRKIIITGLGDTVMECYQKILSELRDRKKMIMSKEIGSTLQKHVEWYFTEDKGDLWVPYPRYLSYILEEAFESNVNVKEFQDSNKKTYVVDFVKGNEVDKEDKHNATVVSVIRKDFTEGIGEVFPKCWTYMAEGENLAEVVLDSSDAEYKDAEAAFLKTIVPYNLSQIKEIRRVQNRSLYQQYQTKKKQLETDLQNVPNIERSLFHGYEEQVEKTILQYGFNRSYAGNTFGGVWYGSGVYFAVKSMYSSNDSYSKPDPQGWKRMFLVKVLTGKTTNVAKGYTDRFPPLIPGSQTDRYNSTCDDMANPTEFVIYNDIQAYPEYVIVFK